MTHFLDVNIKVARLYGQWRNSGDKIYVIYRASMYLAQILYITVQCLYLTLEIDQASALRTANMISISLISFYRTIVWLVNESKMQELIHQANNPELFDNQHEIVVSAHNFSKLHSIYLITSTEVLIIASYGPSLYNLWIAGDDIKSIQLPYHTWFFFDIYQSKFYFVLAVLYQMFGIYVSGHLVTSVTCLYTSLMGHIGGQMKLIAHKFHEMAQNGEDLEPKFRECVQHLTNTIKFSREVAHHNSIGLTGQLIPISFIMMGCAILFTTEPIHTCGSEIIFGSACLLDLLTYCWFGEEICYQTDRCFYELCQVPWYNESKKLKTNYLFTLARLQKTLILKVGGFLPLRLATFVQILRGTYSMFAIMRRFISS